MALKIHPTVLVIGHDVALHYLLGRFAERSGYQLKANTENMSDRDIAAIHPAAIIFLSTEVLAKHRTLLTELAGLDMPILVCSSVIEKARAIELGADYCLLHPLTYDDFQAALTHTPVAKRV